MYVSEITTFIQQLRQERPTLEEEQRKGRALLWDKAPLDLEQRRRTESAKVKQQAYVYYENSPIRPPAD